MRKQRLFVLVAVVIITLADQLTKILSLFYLAPIKSTSIIPNVLDFTYVMNKGAAFGMFANHRWVFMVLTTVVIIALLVYLMVKKSDSKLLTTAFTMIIGGGIGNMIDRVGRGYVIDFIDVKFVNFYVFNVADCFVTVGCGLIVLYLLVDTVKSVKKKNG